jgi:hypothetical protein
MRSSKGAICLLKIVALVLGILVVALRTGAAITIATWGPPLPPGTDETMRVVNRGV